MSKPIITEKVTEKELREAHQMIFSEDAPIAAGALKGNANVIITLDLCFQKLSKCNNFSIPILTPGEFLQQYRKQHL